MNLENKLDKATIHFVKPLEIEQLDHFFSYIVIKTNREIRYNTRYKPVLMEDIDKKRVQVVIDGQINGNNLSFHLGHVFNEKNYKINYSLFDRM